MAHANLRSTSSIEVEPGRRYPGGYDDESVEQFAHEDGQASVHNAEIWGENTTPHFIEALNAGHDTEARLIAHQYRGEVQEAAAVLAAIVPQANSALQRALDAMDAKGRAQIAVMHLRHEIEAQGLKVPGVWSVWWLIAGLGLLFFGETPMISTGYQVLGLSDHPLIPFIPISDELHLAAYGSVTALLILAHVAGHKLRLVAHDFTRRRTAVAEEAKAELPRVSRFQAVIIGTSILGAMPILGGLSAIRADYLQTKGIDAQTLPFLAIQLSIFCAATGVSFMHAHPYGRAWADQVREAQKAEKTWNTAENSYGALLGSVNVTIELFGTLLAQAGQHIGASEADVHRQIALYARRVTLSQPEPTTERLLPKKLPEPSTRTGTGLTNFLSGTGPLPKFDRLTTEALSERQEEIRTGLRKVETTLSTSLATSNNADSLESELAALTESDA